MRHPSEVCERWRVTQHHSTTFAALQKAVVQNPQSGPCVTGCRSVCWKAFLLFRESTAQSWASTLGQARNSYVEKRDLLLRYIKHPEELAAAAADPLADDPDSPWASLREDEAIRAEIAQDVRRLPDLPFYHQDHIQALVLDALFVYCKTHPRTGGYRQGMHELLAPIVFVLVRDAVDRSVLEAELALSPGAVVDEAMLGMLDLNFVEHDAYALFEKLMETAGEFYEVGDNEAVQGRGGAIVDKSRHIHETCLMRVDPELANHLKNIEILPQIFLIRWIRLLFGREFPLDQLLILWDTFFAVDPRLDLVDLVCAAMLLRIRWTLLDADYSVALQLLLKYPIPETPHGPSTFVDDALYLRSHMTPSGGASLMLKYTGRMPATSSGSSSPVLARSGTPVAAAAHGLRSRTPFPPPHHRPSPLPPSGGVETFLHGAARGVLERGERLGINQAVRDAVGEIRKNMQTFQESGRAPASSLRRRRGSSGFGGEDATAAAAAAALAALEKRNKQLAEMLDESVANLRMISASSLADAARVLAVVEVAAAKIQFVRVCLEDASGDVPELSLAEAAEAAGTGTDNGGRDATEEDAALVVQAEGTPAIRPPTEPVSLPNVAALVIAEESPPSSPSRPKPADPAPPFPALLDAMDLSVDGASDQATVPITAAASSRPDAGTAAPAAVKRPGPPVPTRSTIARSSFSWMLEPDQTSASAPPASAFPSVRRSHASASPPGHKKRRSSNTGSSASRERNAFLFGEVTGGGGVGPDGTVRINSGEIFGLQTLNGGSGGSRRERGDHGSA